MLAFGFDSVPLHDVVIVVRAFETGLHLGELVLHSVQLNTCFLTCLAYFTHFFLFLPQLEIHALVLIRELLGEGVLEGYHQHLNQVIA